MAIDFTRQLSFVNPDEFKGVKVAIIGVGAVGSHVALQLAQMGFCKPNCGELHVYDMDIVEEHNLPNQAYMMKHVGMPKVDALASLIKDKMGFDIHTHNERVTEDSDATHIRADYTFLAVDSMETRKMIFEHMLKFNSFTKLMVEARMGSTEGMVFAVNPQSYDLSKVWLSKWYSDEESIAGGCGTPASVAVTAIYLATTCVSQMMHHFRSNRDGQEPVIWNELQIQLSPYGVIGFDYTNTRSPALFP